NRFTSPSEFSNVVLVVENKKLHVNKEFLAIHSPVFTEMFFGESAEKGKEEVEIKDVFYEEFVDFLNVIYPGYSSISNTSFPHIMKLNSRFHVKDVLRKCELFLNSSGHFNEETKFLLSTQIEMLKQLMADAPNPFDAPSQFSNVILVVEGKKLHVNKEFLAIHSPVFAAMLFGSFAEKGKEQIEIKNVAYEEFSDLLKLVYPSFTVVTVDSVVQILKLADQFQMKVLIWIYVYFY
ncbi:hypothetical protein PMAYCL1PPCAC_25685, partial [Pristionchus mayeri]